MWSWPEILSQDSALDFERLLGLWPHTVVGRVRPIGMSAFGDVFLERPAGEVQRLDVFEGGLHHVAPNASAFATLVNSPEWRTENLMPEVVVLLSERGLRRGPGECFGFAPHPFFVGAVQLDRALVMGAYPWHGICSQLLDPPRGVAI